MKAIRVSIKEPSLAIWIVIFLSLTNLLVAQETLTVHTIFVPTFQGFDFEQERIVDAAKGDIVVLPYGIEVSSSKLAITALNKGFIEDIKELPEEEIIGWTDFEDYITDMIYAVNCSNNKYALFELLDVKVSGDEIIGIEIKYKYQPDGSRVFP